MNWLAHLYLSEPNPCFQIGNLLPDMVPAKSIRELPDGFRLGAACHLEIDAFTDTHPLFKRSMHRFSPPLLRYASVFVDIFYDHFLASNWKAYSDVPLTDFSQTIYRAIDNYWAVLPPATHSRLRYLKQQDLLCSYANIEGIRTSLTHMSTRLRRPFRLHDSVSVLQNYYDAFAEDFRLFFPEIISHINDWKAKQRTQKQSF